MQDTIHKDRTSLGFEQHAIVSDTQPVFRCKVGQSFHVAGQIFRQLFYFINNTLPRRLRQRFQVLESSRLKLDVVSHLALLCRHG